MGDTFAARGLAMVDTDIDEGGHFDTELIYLSDIPLSQFGGWLYSTDKTFFGECPLEYENPFGKDSELVRVGFIQAGFKIHAGDFIKIFNGDRSRTFIVGCALNRQDYENHNFSNFGGTKTWILHPINSKLRSKLSKTAAQGESHSVEQSESSSEDGETTVVSQSTEADAS